VRVGVVFGNQAPTAGGGYTYQASLVEAIQTAQTRHEFVLLSFGGELHDPGAPVPWINLTAQYEQPETNRDQSLKKRLRYYWGRFRPGSWVGRAASRSIQVMRTIYRGLYYKAPSTTSGAAQVLDLAARDYGLDVLWFLTPFYKKTSIPFMVTVWDLQHRCQPYFPEVSVTGWSWDAREALYRDALPRAAKVITGTNTGKSEIVQFYGVNPDNVNVIPFPVPAFVTATKPQSINILNRYRLAKNYLLYPAQFWPHKNHFNILLALKHLKQEHFVSLEMAFVGSDKGNETYIRQSVELLELKDQVHFLGFVPDSDLVALYTNALALVFASFFGPDNLPPLEAFAIGCPVIASRVPGAEEQLGSAALFFDPKKPHELSLAIKQLHENAALREELIRKGRLQVRGRTSNDYLSAVCLQVDEFESIRHCWGRNYQHT